MPRTSSFFISLFFSLTDQLRSLPIVGNPGILAEFRSSFKRVPRTDFARVFRQTDSYTDILIAIRRFDLSNLAEALSFFGMAHHSKEQAVSHELLDNFVSILRTLLRVKTDAPPRRFGWRLVMNSSQFAMSSQPSFVISKWNNSLRSGILADQS
jgi:hypothetical protein